ncbi:MAG: hypothetical protein IPP33_02475 [Flavobacteriales bacterium]|nr:hypothetical protein [Flavobacteriales bacterium]
MSDAEFPGITFAWSITNGISPSTGVRRPTLTLTSPGTYNATLTVTTTLAPMCAPENGVVVVAPHRWPHARPPPATRAIAPNGEQRGLQHHFQRHQHERTTWPTRTSPARATPWCPAGGTYPLSVTIRRADPGRSTNGYIDYNNNGVFEDPSEMRISGSTPASTSTTLNANVTIPGGAVLNTLLRMRLYGEAGTFSAAKRTCGATFFIGDVEDYGVYISNNVAKVSIAATPSSTMTLRHERHLHAHTGERRGITRL